MESVVSFFRVDPKYYPRKYDNSNKKLPASQQGKIKDEG